MSPSGAIQPLKASGFGKARANLRVDALGSEAHIENRADLRIRHPPLDTVATKAKNRDGFSLRLEAMTSPPRRRVLADLTLCCVLAASTGMAHAQEEAPAKPPSPWVLLPTLTNNPKLGTSVGALGAYLRKFDTESQLSMFGASAQYTSTDSATVAAFARTSFDADRHRLNLVALGGVIKNDYDDYLGTGRPLKSEDRIRAFVGRYLHRVKDDWFVGVQALATNYQLVGQTALDDEMLALLGLTGFEAGGIGLVLYHDSRDLLDAPKRGWVFNFNNVAYRPRVEGSSNFDVYRADYRHFWSHGQGHVLALRQSNQWTVDAPQSAYAPVLLRGYTAGEYLGKYMSSIEVEERHRLAERWTATLFGGLACLYGAGRSCSESTNLFPSAGVGVQYILKPGQGIVANLEVAVGKDDNRALLFKMGYSW